MSTKKCIVTLISQNQAATLFQSIDPPPECSRSSVRSISRRGSVLECHSGTCGLHLPLCCPNWTDDPTAIAWEPETVKNRMEPNQDYKGGCITSICLLASQASTILVVCGRALPWCKIHRCFIQPLLTNMPLQLLQYTTVIFYFLGDCVLIYGSSTGEKNTMCTFPTNFCWHTFFYGKPGDFQCKLPCFNFGSK